jgi:hypothetical protein
MMEALNSFETSVLTRATRRNILDDGILASSVLINTSGPVPISENVSEVEYFRMRFV